MTRSREHVARRTALHDAPEVHDCDPVAQMANHAEVMGDEQHREAEIGAQRGDQVEDLGLQRDVERGHRFVGD